MKPASCHETAGTNGTVHGTKHNTSMCCVCVCSGTAGTLSEHVPECSSKANLPSWTHLDASFDEEVGQRLKSFVAPHPHTGSSRRTFASSPRGRTIASRSQFSL
jgi:hypothetical protein